MKKSLKTYILLWSTQSLSALGSGLTGYSLVLWLYMQSGSALKTALLSICSYAPYVLMSIFAGALSDRWNKKKTMLLCDLAAALSTVAVLALIKTDSLEVWHLYLINALNGLMNTVQQPAAEVYIGGILLTELAAVPILDLRSLAGADFAKLLLVFGIAFCKLFADYLGIAAVGAEVIGIHCGKQVFDSRGLGPNYPDTASASLRNWERLCVN